MLVMPLDQSIFLKIKSIQLAHVIIQIFCTFSFHPLKTITTGEEGLLTTNKKTIYDLIKVYRSHGIERGKSHWQYDVLDFAMNHRLSDINCALGISQMKKINTFIKERQKIVKNYLSFFI